MDALLAYNVVVDECFKFSITMLLNSTIMLVVVLHYASICSYASILLFCSKSCQHNSPRPTLQPEGSIQTHSTSNHWVTSCYLDGEVKLHDFIYSRKDGILEEQEQQLRTM